MNVARKLYQLIFCCLIPCISYPQNHLLIPDSFYVREHAISITRNYDLETQDKKFACLQRTLQPSSHYTLVNTVNEILAHVHVHVLSQTTYFDIYDDNNQKLGMVEEYFHSSFPSFNIYQGDNKFPVAYAKMNFWGTTFTIKDALTRQEIAEMSRPYFRIKNEWAVTIKEQILFDKKRIDPRLFLSVISVQCDEEHWQPHHLKQALRQKQTYISQLITKLDHEFSDYMPPSDHDDDDFFCHEYQRFCQNKMTAPDIDPQQKMLIALLLKNRLETLKVL